MVETALMEKRLKELVEYVDAINAKLPPGLVNSVGGRATTEENDDGATDYEFTMTTEPFSEFAEVTADTVSFTIDNKKITHIFFEEGWESKDHRDLPFTTENVEFLAKEIYDWINRLTPKA